MSEDSKNKQRKVSMKDVDADMTNENKDNKTINEDEKNEEILNGREIREDKKTESNTNEDSKAKAVESDSVNEKKKVSDSNTNESEESAENKNTVDDEPVKNDKVNVSVDKNSKLSKKKILVFALLAILLFGGGILGSVFWYQNYDPTQENIDVEGRTRDEIQSEIDERTAESMMTINMSSDIRIEEDGKVFIDFENSNIDKEDPNSWYQKFEIVQDDNVVYSSPVIKPGDKLEYFNDGGKLKEGSATVNIYRCKQFGKQIGSSSSIDLNIIDIR